MKRSTMPTWALAGGEIVTDPARADEFRRRRDALRWRVEKSDQRKRARVLAQREGRAVSPALKKRILRMRKSGDTHGEPLTGREIHRRLKAEDVPIALKTVQKVLRESPP